ncbi:S8 family serine peptidase [Rubrimonas cliftonensis]|uniref:Subtilase family protein n=1 Tax=Rubrimonas cliftonensis TaxID=89524 RepID=A0A1H3X9T1_9RHOB|nr:S8 family serine peptidase [Rubrimonas cliftonensis]SDZ96155.1 Subtilase family protein [Rubrimonas cliftonensis]
MRQRPVAPLAAPLAALLAALLAASCAAPSQPLLEAGGSAQPAAEILDAREVVVLTAPPHEATLARSLRLGYTEISTHRLTDLDEVLIVLAIPPGRTIAQAIAEIEAASPGATAGAHHLYRLQSATGAEAGRFYANALIGWPDDGCEAVRSVGMIDAGVAPSHPGLADGRVVQRKFFETDAPPASDHGDLMAGLLTGPGRLTGAALHSANVVDPAIDGGDAAGVVGILRAVDWLRGEGVDVVNISLAGPRNKLLDRGLARAAARDMVLVAAAGNDGPAVPPRFPAAFPFVLAVTAVDRTLEVYDRAARGAEIDLAAPGVDILLMDRGRMRVLNGTSAAAPFVTAAIAADHGLESLEISAVRRRLAAGARDLGPAGRDAIFGAGLVSAPESCGGG